MTKPIFVIRFPNHVSIEEIDNHRDAIRKSDVMKEYNILVVKDKFNDLDIKFECYSAQYTEIEFKELESKLLNLIK